MSGKTVFVYSTLVSDNLYVVHETGGNDLPQIQGSGVLIRGGAGLADKFLQTKYGVMTEITEEELEYCQQDPVFRMHVKNGFLLVTELKEDPDKVAADMKGRDPGGPVVPQDLEKDGKAAKELGTKDKKK